MPILSREQFAALAQQYPGASPDRLIKAAQKVSHDPALYTRFSVDEGASPDDTDDHPGLVASAAELLPMAGQLLGSPWGVGGQIAGHGAGQGLREVLQRGAEIPGAVADILTNWRSGNDAVRKATLKGAGAGVAEGVANVLPGGRSTRMAAEAFTAGKPLTATANLVMAGLDVAGLKGAKAVGEAVKAAPFKTALSTGAGVVGGAATARGAGAVAQAFGAGDDTVEAASILGGLTGGVATGGAFHKLADTDATGAARLRRGGPLGNKGLRRSDIPAKLVTQIDEAIKAAKADAKAQGAKWRHALEPQISQQLINAHTSNPKLRQLYQGLYHSIALPTDYEGVDFDYRAPLQHLLVKQKGSKEVGLAPWVQERLDKAYEVGGRHSVDWGSPGWVQKMLGDDPEAALRFMREFGALSPGERTDANSVIALEIFLRHQLEGEPLADVLNSMTTRKAVGNLPSKMPNLNRAEQGLRIQSEKTENLSNNDLGINNGIPIDLWLMRALGAAGDTTPSAAQYDILQRAFQQYAKGKGREDFPVMAQVWTGMQDIGGKRLPGWKESVQLMGIDGDLTNPQYRRWVIDNLPALRLKLNKKLSKEEQALLAAVPPPPQVPDVPVRPEEDFVAAVAKNSIRDRQLSDKVPTAKARERDALSRETFGVRGINEWGDEPGFSDHQIAVGRPDYTLSKKVAGPLPPALQKELFEGMSDITRQHNIKGKLGVDTFPPERGASYWEGVVGEGEVNASKVPIWTNKKTGHAILDGENQPIYDPNTLEALQLEQALYGLALPQDMVATTLANYKPKNLANRDMFEIQLPEGTMDRAAFERLLTDLPQLKALIDNDTVVPLSSPGGIQLLWNTWTQPGGRENLGMGGQLDRLGRQVAAALAPQNGRSPVLPTARAQNLAGDLNLNASNNWTEPEGAVGQKYGKTIADILGKNPTLKSRFEQAAPAYLKDVNALRASILQKAGAKMNPLVEGATQALERGGLDGLRQYAATAGLPLFALLMMMRQGSEPAAQPGPDEQ